MAYLDHCASTPLDAEVRRAMESVMDLSADAACANPSSVHGPGRKARAIMNEARAKIARAIGALPAEIVFTASGSEANNLAVKGIALRSQARPFHLIVSAIEHDSILNAARYLAGRFDWVRLREVPPDSEGIVSSDAVERACEEGASLVCVMAVNNETGVRQPIQEIARVAHRRGAIFHTDAVQALGRVEIGAKNLGCDLLSASSHKIYGPAGVGFLYVQDGIKLDSLIHGGHQEKERRAGTENLEGITGFARAVGLALERMAEDRLRMMEVEKAFLDRLRRNGTEFQINGSTAEKVPGVLNLSCAGIQSHDLVVGMDLAGHAISAGAACSSGVIEPSHVLRAMKLEPWRIEGGIRISFGRRNGMEDVRSAADALSDLCGKLKSVHATESERRA